MPGTEQQIRNHVQAIVDLLPELAGPIEHLEPVARDIRNDLLLQLHRCREEFAQPKVADLWALCSVLMVVLDRR